MSRLYSRLLPRSRLALRSRERSRGFLSLLRPRFSENFTVAALFNPRCFTRITTIYHQVTNSFTDQTFSIVTRSFTRLDILRIRFLLGLRFVRHEIGHSSIVGRKISPHVAPMGNNIDHCLQGHVRSVVQMTPQVLGFLNKNCFFQNSRQRDVVGDLNRCKRPNIGDQFVKAINCLLVRIIVEKTNLPKAIR